MRSLSAMLAIALLALVAGHIVGIWQIPTIGGSPPSPSRSFDPRSITVAYSRVQTNGVSPWSSDDTTRIMSRFADRWSKATLGRSRLLVLEETDLRDVLIVFNDKRVIPAAGARTIQYAGGRLRYIEVFPPTPGLLSPVLGLFAPAQRVDIEYTAGTLLHEMGHVLGCCSGPGTSDGHFIGPNCQRILCSPHGNAENFSDEELVQMGLRG